MKVVALHKILIEIWRRNTRFLFGKTDKDLSDNKITSHREHARIVCTANPASRASDPDVVRDPRRGSFSLDCNCLSLQQYARHQTGFTSRLT
jgi:hypothetical protein